jgi:hypothetical protein
MLYLYTCITLSQNQLLNTHTWALRTTCVLAIHVRTVHAYRVTYTHNSSIANVFSVLAPNMDLENPVDALTTPPRTWTRASFPAPASTASRRTTSSPSSWPSWLTPNFELRNRLDAFERTVAGAWATVDSAWAHQLAGPRLDRRVDLAALKRACSSHELSSHFSLCAPAATPKCRASTTLSRVLEYATQVRAP